MTKQTTKNILDFGGVERLATNYYPVRDERRQLRRFISAAVGTLAILTEHREALGLPPLNEGGVGMQHVAENLQETYFTNALAQRLRFSPDDLLAEGGAFRLILQSHPWGEHRYTKDIKMTYQTHQPDIPAQERPAPITIAEVLARPTKDCVELTLDDRADLPVHGRGNMLGAAPLMEAVMDDMALLRTYASML